MKINNIIILSLLFGSGLVACQKEPLARKEAEKIKEAVGLSSYADNRDHYLYFGDEAEFCNTLEYLSGKDPDFINQWEETKAFFSMRRAFEELVQQETAITERLDSLKEDSIRYYSGLPTQHGPAATTYAHMIIKERMPDGGEYFERNIHNPHWASLVNTFGIVRIGDKIYQHTREYIKSIDDGDATKIEELKAATESQPHLHITVAKVSNSGTASFVRSKIGNSGRLRIIVYQNFTQNTSSTQPNVRVSDYRITVRSLRRRLWGAWYDNINSNIVGSGNIVGNITNGWTQNNTNLNINWSAANTVTTVSPQHTFIYYVPRNQGLTDSSPFLRTDGFHPTIYSAWHSANMNNQHGSVAASSTYP